MHMSKTKSRTTRPAADQAKPQAANAAVPTAAKAMTGKAKTSKPRKTQDAPKPKKISALDAAARVLTETGQAMNCHDLIDTMAKKGYWSSPNGRTPAATLFTAVT